ncbi:MAG: ATP-binding protein [Propionicimonas sp.]
MTSAPDPVRWNAIDRPLGWLIALGGCILILDQTVFHLDELADFALWWNAGALLVVASIVVLAVSGMWLPRPVLAVFWRALPLCYLTLQAAWIIGYRGADLASALPWLWSVEPAVITLLLLTFRPAVAVGTGLAFSLTPAVVSLLTLHYLPDTIRVQTPYQLGNVVYVAIFIGVRIQLERLHAGEREAQRQHQRQVKGAALLDQHAVLARFVHDEVLSALSAAMHTDGPASGPLRRDARNAIAAVGLSAHAETEEHTRLSGEKALAALTTHLRGIDDGFTLEADCDSGLYPGKVVRDVTLAAGEALRNSLRHAGEAASRKVRITLSDEVIRVSVQDDGIGFMRDAHSPRLGVQLSIVDRMDDLGGSALVDSAPGQGTKVVLTWPT